MRTPGTTGISGEMQHESFEAVMLVWHDSSVKAAGDHRQMVPSRKGFIWVHLRFIANERV
jgi:hypothetical protein